MFEGIQNLNNLKATESSGFDIKGFEKKCYQALNDDMNSPILISHLFDGIRYINSIKSGKEKISAEELEKLKALYKTFVIDLLGLKEENSSSNNEGLSDELMDVILKLRKNAKENKDFSTSDKIRDMLLELGVEVKDTKDGAEWKLRG